MGTPSNVSAQIVIQSLELFYFHRGKSSQGSQFGTVADKIRSSVVISHSTYAYPSHKVNIFFFRLL